MVPLIEVVGKTCVEISWILAQKKYDACRKTCAIFSAVRTSKLYFLTALHRPRIRGHKFLTAHRIGPWAVFGPFLHGPSLQGAHTNYELISHSRVEWTSRSVTNKSATFTSLIFCCAQRKIVNGKLVLCFFLSSQLAYVASRLRNPHLLVAQAEKISLFSCSHSAGY